MFKEILVAVKFSAAGAHALKMAVQLAEKHEARLHVFHALDPPGVVRFGVQVPAVDWIAP